MKRLLLPLLLVACATSGGFKAKLQSWMGQDANRLIMAWGPPSQTYDLPNGNRMYTWLWVGNTVAYANYNAYLNMVTAGSVTRWCKASMTANPESQLIAWQFNGNACRA